ncbi:MAG TPA: CoA-binding protein [Vicinamibacterales bacterium]|nr:CoA-binding protein [Vicinamibacterales bacterium]
MTTTTLDMKVQDFLAQKRIAVAGVSRDKGHHPVGNVIYHRLKTTGHEVFAVNPHMQTFEGSLFSRSAVNPWWRGRGRHHHATDNDTTDRTPATRRAFDACGCISRWTTARVFRPEAVEYCHQHDISVIAGACPMMYGEGPDVGHTCMRWLLRLTGGLPT